jgi:hypothetical protein
VTLNIWNDLRTWRFWRHFFIHFLAGIGFVALILKLLATIIPDLPIPHGARVLMAILASCAIYSLVRSWPRPIEQTYSSPNTRIRVLKGNLLDQDGHLVIGVCDTFDTSIPVIISKSSLLGQAIDRFFGGDVKEVDRRLEEALKSEAVVGSVVKEGKQNRYSVGTVATLKESSRRLFLLAYSEMSDSNEARTTVDAIWKSLLTLWREISKHGNGGPVSIAVLGGGPSRISQVLPAQDSIRFILLSFMLASRSEKICDELRVVVRPEDYKRLDRLELQSFLSSLKPS